MTGTTLLPHTPRPLSAAGQTPPLHRPGNRGQYAGGPFSVLCPPSGAVDPHPAPATLSRQPPHTQRDSPSTQPASRLRDCGALCLFRLPCFSLCCGLLRPPAALQALSTPAPGSWAWDLRHSLHQSERQFPLLCPARLPDLPSEALGRQGGLSTRNA